MNLMEHFLKRKLPAAAVDEGTSHTDRGASNTNVQNKTQILSPRDINLDELPYDLKRIIEYPGLKLQEDG